MAWKDPVSAHQGGNHTTKNGLCRRLGIQSQESLDTPRTRPCVGSRERAKEKKEKDDLREGKMKLEDRLAFVEGKKAEVSSIFVIL